ncbi:MAG TPA: hypothetical protein VGK40_06195, partial [Verrucomicrobiae bacterium]
MKRNQTTLLAFIAFTVFFTSVGRLNAQGTGFTYQGRLTDNGNPANGNYDLRCALFDAATGSGQIGNPITNAPVAVSNGLFTVTLDFGAGAFSGAARCLEIGVRTNGSVGPYSTLSPRQPVTASPYAITAGNVTGPINGGAILSGTISGAQLASGAAAANLQAGGQSAVASGGVILSESPDANNLTSVGYVKIGRVDLAAEAWQARASGTAPAARYLHTAVWTGSEMIVWGGDGGFALNTGGRYNPAANSWTAVSTNGAPAGRVGHTAVWTGTEMVVWGGDNVGGILNTGGRYNPAGNSWTAVSTTGAPSGRFYHTAVWTGTEMIVWGGVGLSGEALNDGGRYNPAGNSWTAVSTTGAPARRDSHTAV